MDIHNLSFAYTPDKPILQNISFSVEPGQCMAILGNNGAGKSTLLKCLNHIIRPSEGTVMLNGVNLLKLSNRENAKRMSFVAQRSNIGTMSVYDTVMLGRKPYMRFGITQRDYRIVDSVLERMGLVSMASKYLDELSGGEVQKVMLARALAQEPEILLLYEPTSNLDLKNQYEVMELVSQICRTRQIAAIVVIHDLNLALRYCNRVLFMQNQGVYACGGPEIVNEKSLQDVYGIHAKVQECNGCRQILVCA